MCSGNFKENQLNGFGCYQFANQDYYQGNFLNGKFHGMGAYYCFKNQTVIQGLFENGLKQKQFEYFMMKYDIQVTLEYLDDAIKSSSEVTLNEKSSLRVLSLKFSSTPNKLP